MTGPLADGSAAAPALAALGPRERSHGVAPPAGASDADIRGAAARFEGLLIEQLVQTMRSSANMFSGTGGDLYGEMFDQHMGDALASAGGLGLANVLAEAMGATPTPPSVHVLRVPSTALLALPGQAPPAVDLGPILPDRPAFGAPLPGLAGRLQHAADSMLPESGVAPQWGRDGALGAEDLVAPPNVPPAEPGSEAVRALRHARTFEGYYKCNLFAFELARRAGFEVPVWGSGQRWGYPGPTAAARDASDGELHGGWGEVITDASAEQLDSAITRGELAVLVTGDAGVEGHRGHMGVIERVRSIERDGTGAISRITFDGWEGRQTGGMHLTERVWTTLGHGVPGARRAFGRIELIALHPSAAPSAVR